MSELKEKVLTEILPLVQTPGQYVGNEVNMVKKNFDEAKVTFALAFPDLYRIGMSNLGIKIIYDIINRREDALAERVFAPWHDLEQLLRKNNIPLFTLENAKPLSSFDIVGFSIHTELCYTNILNMLDLGGIPLKASERGDDSPLVCCGGHNINYEPVTAFFDFIFIGEVEDAIHEILDSVIRCKGKNRLSILKELEKIEGIYVPLFFEVTYNAAGTVKRIIPHGAKRNIKRRIVEDLDSVPFPTKPVVPNVKVIHDRITIELMRGCPNKCRFCMSGNVNKKVRKRSQENIVSLCKHIYSATGYDEIGLLSLSTGDYPGIMDLVKKISGYFSEKHVGISLPSLRITKKILALLPEVKTVRKSGLTFAPETGNECLRRLQKKYISNDELFEVISEAYDKGWGHIKLYFMVGLPGELKDDIESISTFVNTVSDLGKKTGKSAGRVNLTVSPFIPKPFTPFQWEPMNSKETIEEKIEQVKKKITRRVIKYSYPDIGMTVLEGVFARGDRRLSDVIESAWGSGARFDAWDECFSWDIWRKAFDKAAIKPEFYTTRQRGIDEVFPWSHIVAGSEENIKKDYDLFLKEKEERV